MKTGLRASRSRRVGLDFEFVANTGDGVFAVDDHQRIVLWNDGATRILGHEAAAVLGRPCYEIVRGRDGEGCTVCRRGCATHAAALRLEVRTDCDLCARARDGRDVWVNLSTLVVPSSHDGLSVLVHLFRDVTAGHERERVVEELAASLARLSVPAPAVTPRETRLADTARRLTPREREVLGLLASGRSTELIAKRLHISPRTVRNHVQNVLDKLGVHSRLEAVTFSLRNGLL